MICRDYIYPLLCGNFQHDKFRLWNFFSLTFCRSGVNTLSPLINYDTNCGKEVDSKYFELDSPAQTTANTIVTSCCQNSLFIMFFSLKQHDQVCLLGFSFPEYCFYAPYCL